MEKKVNIVYMFFLGYLFKKDLIGLGRKLIYCVMEMSMLEIVRYLMVM